MLKLPPIFYYIFPGGWRFWVSASILCGYTCFVTYIDDHGFPVKAIAKADDTLGISVVMGMIFAFRLNSAYDRWWEGRKLWGQLVNDTRNLAIKVRELVNPDSSDALAFAELLIALPKSIRDHLRGKRNLDYIPSLHRESLSRVKHVPLALAGLIYKQLRSWNRKGKISDTDLLQLDRHARGYMDICGACERILKSPISKTIRLVFWMGIILYSIFMPWILVPDNDQNTLIMTLVAMYFVVVFEFVAQEAEDPFGTAANDLPLDSICQTIEDSVRDTFSISDTSTRSLE